MSTNEAKTLVVIGAGPATGLSIAHRYGRGGYRVALVARNAERVQTYAEQLTDKGIDANGYAADASNQSALLAVLDQIEHDHGRIDAVYYGPSGDPIDSLDVLAATVENVRRYNELFLYSPVALVGRVLPGMLQRGAGTLLFAGGTSAKYPVPMLGALSPSIAALRNYALALNVALADKGIYAGSLLIGGLIERSAGVEIFEANKERFGGLELETVDPDQIADTAWRLSVERDVPEVHIGSAGVPA